MHRNSIEKMSNSRTSVIAALMLALIVVLTGACNKSSNTSGSTAAGGGALSPTDTLKAYYDADNKKDIAGVKKYLSQGSIKFMEDAAKKMGRNLDDVLKEQADKPSRDLKPEFSNEKITGDTASVDVKVEGQTVTMPMVKEGGEWKIAIDKFFEKMRGQMGGPSSAP